jgi:hypothetical protein
MIIPRYQFFTRSTMGPRPDVEQFQLPTIVAVFDGLKESYQGLMLNCIDPAKFLNVFPQTFNQTRQKSFSRCINLDPTNYWLYNPINQQVFPWCDFVLLFDNGNVQDFRSKINEIFLTGRPVKFYYVIDNHRNDVEMAPFDPQTQNCRLYSYHVNEYRFTKVMKQILRGISNILADPDFLDDVKNQPYYSPSLPTMR